MFKIFGLMIFAFVIFVVIIVLVLFVRLWISFRSIIKNSNQYTKKMSTSFYKNDVSDENIIDVEAHSVSKDFDK